MNFFKKKESAPELDLSLIEYIPGATLYCGADDILMIMLSLQVSIKTLDTVRVLKPKEYKKMVCLVDSWDADIFLASKSGAPCSRQSFILLPVMGQMVTVTQLDGQRC